jgi:hypothetical protein
VQHICRQHSEQLWMPSFEACMLSLFQHGGCSTACMQGATCTRMHLAMHHSVGLVSRLCSVVLLQTGPARDEPAGCAPAEKVPGGPPAGEKSNLSHCCLTTLVGQILVSMHVPMHSLCRHTQPDSCVLYVDTSTTAVCAALSRHCCCYWAILQSCHPYTLCGPPYCLVSSPPLAVAAD